MKQLFAHKLSAFLIIVLLISSCSKKELEVVDITISDNQKESQEKHQEKKWSDIFSGWMQNGKESEEQKQWIMALWSYYMALETWVDLEEADIAYKTYNDLAELIRRGSPGRGSYDTFSNYDAWKQLLISSEAFGNSFFPYEIYLGAFETTNLNMEKKTADYSVPITFVPSLMYTKTIGIISEGYENTDKNGWNDLPNVFPKSPLTENSLYTENLLSNDGKISSFAYKFPYSVEISLKNTSIIPYEGIFSIDDLNGNSFIESSPYVLGVREDSVGTNELEYLFSDIGFGGVLKFKNVPQAGIQAIESGKAIISLKNLNLIYGDIKSEAYMDGRRIFEGNNKAPVNIMPIQMHNRGNARLSKAKYVFLVMDAEMNNFIPNYTISGKQVHCVYFDAKKVFEILNNNKEMTSVNMLCLMCNELSRIYGRTPVYYVGSSSEAGNFLNTNSKVARDATANGFQIPMIGEIKKILTNTDNSNLPKLEETSLLFGGSRYNYFSVDKDFLSDSSYLMLYYLE